MLVVDGRRIDFVDQGSGPALLFVPGSFATPAAWRGVQRGLAGRYRCVGTSLCGYGGTGETRSLDDLGMEHEVRVVRAVADRIGGPVILVGHSFGGTVALAATLAGAADVRGLAVFEANPLALVEESGFPALYGETRAMSEAFEAAWRDGEVDAAGRIIDFWGGPGAFAALPDAVREFCRTTACANVLDWRTAFGFRATMADYATIGVPVLLVRGGNANDAMVAITDALQRSLPDVEAAVVDGAGHFLISTHAEACAELLDRFLRRVAA